MKNDKLKEAKQKRKELKEQGKDVSMTEEENKASGECSANKLNSLGLQVLFSVI